MRRRPAERVRIALLGLAVTTTVLILGLVLGGDEWLAERFATDGSRRLSETEYRLAPRWHWVITETTALPSSGATWSSFTRDPLTGDLYFAESDAQSRTDLFRCRRERDRYLPKEPLFELNTGSRELDPCFGDGGRLLYFSSDRPGGRGGLDIFVSERRGEGFGEPAPLPRVNSSADDRFPSTSRSGDSFVFASTRLSLDGVGLDLYEIHLESPTAEEARRVVALNEGGRIDLRSPALSPDGLSLVFSAIHESEGGGYDLFRAVRVDGSWRTPEKIQGLSTDQDEVDSSFSTGDGRLAFVRRSTQTTADAGPNVLLAERREIVEIVDRDQASLRKLLLLLWSALLALLLTWLCLKWNTLHPFLRFLIISLIVHLLVLLYIHSRPETAIPSDGPGEKAYVVSFSATSASESSDDASASPVSATADRVEAARAAPTPANEALRDSQATSPESKSAELLTVAARSQERLEPLSPPRTEDMATEVAALGDLATKAPAQEPDSRRLGQDASPSPALTAATSTNVARNEAETRGSAPSATARASSSAPEKQDLARESRRADASNLVERENDPVPNRRSSPSTAGQTASADVARESAPLKDQGGDQVPAAKSSSLEGVASTRAASTVGAASDEPSQSVVGRSTQATNSDLLSRRADSQVGGQQDPQVSTGATARQTSAPSFAASRSHASEAEPRRNATESARALPSGPSEAKSLGTEALEVTSRSESERAAAFGGPSAGAPTKDLLLGHARALQANQRVAPLPESPIARGTKALPPPRVRSSAREESASRTTAESSTTAMPSKIENARALGLDRRSAVSEAVSQASKLTQEAGERRSADLEKKSLISTRRVVLGEEATARIQGPEVLSQRVGAARLAAVRRGGGSDETEAAVLNGLRYLKTRQRRSGGFGAPSQHEKYGDFRIGKTGLALLAFLGSGYTHKTEGEFQTCVTDALAFLVNQQDLASGHIGDSEAYGHGIATYAIAEAYAMTQDPILLTPLKRAVQRIERAQIGGRAGPRRGGFPYYYRDPERSFDDWPRLSVSVWQIMALKSARIGGIEIEERVFDQARAYVLGCFDREMAAFRYNHDPEWLNGTYPTLPGSNAAALFSLELLDVSKDDPRVSAGIDYVRARRPAPEWRRYSDRQFAVQGLGNEYYLYYATLAVFVLGGDLWSEWNREMSSLLVSAQSQDGSFAPASYYSTYSGDTDRDRVYSTAMAVLTLEVYYRYFTPLLSSVARSPSPDGPSGK